MWTFIEQWFGGRTFGAVRSPKWSEVRNSYLALHPTCAVCGTKGELLNALNIHHIQPFHLDPTLELNSLNLITLCRRDHFLIGHLLSWKSFNKDVRADALYLLDKIENRP